MPWKECSVMDERLQFVARRLAGEPMAELCREFRYLPQDRLQDLRSLPGMRHSGVYRQKPASLPLRAINCLFRWRISFST